MSSKLRKWIFGGIILLIVILLFTIIDHFLHGLNGAWGVPDYYFKDKIPAGFLWGIAGLLFARKFQNVWLKSLIFAGIIAAALQTRYFLEGYALSFVLIFLLFHFIILYFLSLGMFLALKSVSTDGEVLSAKLNNNMKKIIIAIIVLAIAGVGTYYLVFNNGSNGVGATPAYVPPTIDTASANTNAPAVPAPASAFVEIKNFSFNPQTLSVKIGDTITWTNNDGVPHTITSDSGNLLKSGTIAPGQSFSFTFTKAGAENYHCGIHPMMKAVVVVK